jgi:hypothetical protein
MAEIFRELHGDYVENAGQQLSLREYLDYFEPLGSALARLPDGAGGPFVHHFNDSGGRTISALGWVVSARSKRFGGWKLWGMWTDQPMPAVALPLFWPVLADPARVSDWVGRANQDAALLLDRERWPEVLDAQKATRLRDAPFREYLKAELSRAWAVPLPHRHPIEVELTPRMLDLLPWLYLLGPVDPAAARLQPNRYNGAGYQYILSDELPAISDAEIPREVESIVDAAARSAGAGWRMATEYRARRERPRTKPVKPVKPRERERNEMRSGPVTPSPSPAPPPGRPAPPPRNDAFLLADAAWKLAVLVLLAWIAWNVHLLRKAGAPRPAGPATTATTATQEEPTTSVTPVYEPDLSTARLRRIAAAVQARSPRGIRVNSATLAEITAGGPAAPDKLARVAVEIFLRRNRCFTPTAADAIDARFSAGEQRAIRNCALLQDERLMQEGTQPDVPRAIAWLEEAIP